MNYQHDDIKAASMSQPSFNHEDEKIHQMIRIETANQLRAAYGGALPLRLETLPT